MADNLELLSTVCPHCQTEIARIRRETGDLVACPGCGAIGQYDEVMKTGAMIPSMLTDEELALLNREIEIIKQRQADD